MKAMIFAAGLGTRLKPLTDTMPKALVPLAGKTLLQWQIEKLKAAGITDIVVNVHHFPDQIIDYLRENNQFGCYIQVSDERNMLLETGGGLRKAHPLLTSNLSPLASSPILVCNVDILSNIDIPALLNAYNPEEMGVVVVYPRDTQRYLLFDDNSRLRGWTNIATGEVRGPLSDNRYPIANTRKLAFSGMQVLNPRIFEVMEKVVAEKGEKFSLIDLYLSIAEKEILRAFIPENYRMMDVGKINQLSEAEAFAQAL
ncbi:MAG: nucleotidyltransferase family protein [Paludibacteraceae bacterium]|nr:nucleotidyltransferase family protein [Paludibacteraceae bacterium]